MVEFAREFGADRDSRAWELDQLTGLIRTTSSPALRELGDPPLGSKRAASLVDQRSLREHRLEHLGLEERGLVDPIAAHLGATVTDAIGWTTLAPSSGTTPVIARGSARRLTWSGQHRSFAMSRRAALLEGTERLSGSHQLSGEATVSTARALAGPVLTPLDFDSIPDSSYGGDIERFDPDRLHEWVRATSMSTCSPVWIPREYVYFAEVPHHDRWALGSSSGCATGSSVDEATLFGLLELVERDTFVNSWYGGIPPIPVDPMTVAGAAELVVRAALLGWPMQLALLRNTWGIPVFVATVNTKTVRVFGAAAHLDLETAARRAIAEAFAYAPGRIAELSERSGRAAELLANPWLAQNIDDHPLLPVASAHQDYGTMCGEPGLAIKVSRAREHASAGAELLSRATPDNSRGVRIAELADGLTELLSADGVETYRVVQTAPFQVPLGLHTVMALAPSLSQLDFGWDAQRVRTSSRPERQAVRLTGRPGTPRLLPHPFS
ncbi:ribosomal protein S12 methylthiotransferase accessory factor [Curtobacterium sp. PhB78]|nr:ribosomal protein S12 methylthiotransferase accessory factor [Curtobacterium sp. PhB78]